MYTRDFIHQFRDAIAQARIPAAYKLLLFVIANHARKDGSNAYPAQSTLAAACGCSDRTVRRHLDHLQEAGWLLLTERGCGGEGRGGQRRANVYQLGIGRNFVFKDGAVRLAPDDDLPATAAPVVTIAPRRVELEADFTPAFEGFGANIDIDAIVDF